MPRRPARPMPASWPTSSAWQTRRHCLSPHTEPLSRQARLLSVGLRCLERSQWGNRWNRRQQNCEHCHPPHKQSGSQAAPPSPVPVLHHQNNLPPRPSPPRQDTANRSSLLTCRPTQARALLSLHLAHSVSRPLPLKQALLGLAALSPSSRHTPVLCPLALGCCSVSPTQRAQRTIATKAVHAMS